MDEKNGIYKYEDVYAYREGNKVTKVNLEISKNGGLEIVPVRANTTEFLDQDEIEKKEPIICEYEIYGGKFIPVNGFFIKGSDEIDLNYRNKEIFQNAYLRNKCKYVLIEGVVEKIRFNGKYYEIIDENKM